MIGMALFASMVSPPIAAAVSVSANVTLPVINGEAVSGTALSATPGVVPGSTLTANQWYIFNENATLSAIAGATTTSYTPVSGDLGKYLTFGSTFANGQTYFSDVVAVANTFVNATDVQTAVTAASAGAVIAIRTGTLTLPQTNSSAYSVTKSITLMAAKLGLYESDPFGGSLGIHPARFARTVTFDGFVSIATGVTLKLRGIKQTLTAWPAWGQTWPDISVSNLAPMINLNGSANLDVQLCEYCIGYGGGGTTAFSLVPNYYPDQHSSTTYYLDPTTSKISPTQDSTYTTAMPAGWGDTITAGAYNRFASGPQWISSSSSWTGNLTAKYNYVHDAFMTFTPYMSAAGQALEIDCNWAERTYHDYIQLNIKTAAAAVPAYVKVTRNILQDQFSDARDNLNPHNDFLQAYASAGNTDSVIRNFDMSRNVYFYTGPQLHAPQFGWLAASVDHQATVKMSFTGTTIRENIGIGVNKLVTSDGFSEGYIRNNVGYIRDDAPSGGFNWIAYIGITRTYFSSGGALLNTSPDAISFLSGNVYEQLSASGNRTVSTNNSLLGPKGARLVSLSTALNDPTRTITNANDAFVASKGKLAGQGSSYATIKNMITDPVDWSGEVIQVGIVDKINLSTSTLTRSFPSKIFGGNPGSTTLAIDQVTGLEWRTFSSAYESAERTTVVNGTAETSPAGAAWSSSSGTVTVGDYIQVRTTSAASPSTPVQSTFRIGGTTRVVYNTRTATNNTFPSMNVPGATRLGRNTGIGVPDGNKLLFLFKGTPTGVTGTQGLIYQLTGGRIQIVMNGSALQVLIRNVSSANVAYMLAPNVFSAGVEVSLAVSIDLTAEDFGSGVQFYKNGVQITSFSTAIFTPANGNIPYSVSNSYGVFGSNNNGAAPTNTYTGKVKLIALAPVSVDLSDPDNYAAASVSIDDLGPAGEGINGGSPAPIFIVGNATTAEAGTANLGSGGAFTKNGTGTFTVDSSQTWPPVLSLYANVPPTTGTINQPLTISFKPTGYAKSGVTLTPSASGVAGSFDAASKSLPAGNNGVSFTFTPTATGTLTISLTNDGGYTNPPNFTITIS